jgi:AAA15 family ATPase/GTPase
VQRLSRVNLIVGKNNAGKSAFLEAVELYASNASWETIINLVDSRQETWTGTRQVNYRGLSNNPIRHLFHLHELPNFNDEGIVLGQISDDAKLHIKVAAYRTDLQADGSFSRVRVTNEKKEHSLETIELSLVSEEGDKVRQIVSLGHNGLESERRPSEFKYILQVVHTENMSNNEVAALWDLTSLTELESQVIDALKLIEPKVTGVSFVDNADRQLRSFRTRNDNRIPIVKIDGIKEPLPLKSMGDGMTRLFHIIVALVNAQNGILLVDEFENGLYWKVQPKVWDVVFQLADRLNVQIFATTHSRDCIRAFDEAWNKHPQSGAFFRLDARPEGVKITEYNAETLTDAIETDVEVR